METQYSAWLQSPTYSSLRLMEKLVCHALKDFKRITILKHTILWSILISRMKRMDHSHSCSAIGLTKVRSILKLLDNRDTTSSIVEEPSMLLLITMLR